jgi:hypothetical protein
MAEQVAARVDSQPGILTGPVGQRLPKGLAAAAEVGEVLLGAGAALVINNELEGLEEWLSLLTRWVRTREDAPSIGLRWILPPAATLAVHSAGALAWHRRRYDAVAKIIDAQLDGPGRWIHHHVLADSAGAVLPWAIETASASAVLARADATLQGELEAAAKMVAGIVALKGTMAVKAEVLAQRQTILGPTEAFPGFYYEPASYWAPTLPSEFTANRTFEKNVAERIFGLQPIQLRSDCQALTMPIAAIISELNREIGRIVRWVPRVFSQAWTEWCGGAA